MDLNRAGTPLLEIVTEPELRSSAEAVGYAKALHALVVWLGISHGNMQEGNFRCDANVSVRPKGETKFGTRCEIKNINSFKFLQDAIDYEVARQIDVIENGGVVNDHHGVGLKLSRLMKEAYGPAMQVLTGLKKSLDPNGIMNPYKLGL